MQGQHWPGGVDRVIKVTTTTVKLEMSAAEVGKLKYLLLNNVEWEDDLHGKFAKEVFEQLDQAGISEDYGD